MKRWFVAALKVMGALMFVAAAVFLFNYLRHVVFWAHTETIEFASADGTVLRGTLVKPSREGAPPAVVMLHGSGPDGQDEPSYKVQANAIVRSGVAVLLYDKRGVGESDGDFAAAEYRDFIADGIAAVKYLATRADVDASNIGLHTNSESGWFAPEIAVTTGQVAWIFNRVGPPLSWRHTVIWEVRNDLLAAGVTEAELPPLLEVTMRRWQHYIDVDADPLLAEGSEHDSINAELKRLVVEIPAAEGEIPDELPDYEAGLYRNAAERLGYDPQPFLWQLEIPLVYTFGADDINVPTAASVAWLESLRAEYPNDIRVVAYEGVGHPLANLTGIFNAGYVPAYMDLLYDFYSARSK
jgi:pimeloyl-ACP methyl ester carboxylesterase